MCELAGLCCKVWLHFALSVFWSVTTSLHAFRIRARATLTHREGEAERQPVEPPGLQVCVSVILSLWDLFLILCMRVCRCP